MSLLHLSLIAGLAVITVPILLHLFGQRQPQLIDFPALRFVRQTTREQSSSWQLRHLLLLLLRVLLLAAMVLALTRPRVHSAMLGSIIGVAGVAVAAAFATLVTAVALVSKRPKSLVLTCLLVSLSLWGAAAFWGYKSFMGAPAVPSSDQSAPVATAIIVDNGPSMAYRANNEVRLDVARNMATWILDKLPHDSRVGILTGAPVGSLSLDPATAKTQVKIIEQSGAHVDLLGRIRTALDLVLSNELQRKEVYVITDLSSSSWSSTEASVKDLLKEHAEEVLLQIIDIGAEDKANWHLGDAVPDFQTIPADGDVSISIAVERPAASRGGTVTVELIHEEVNANFPVIRDGKLDTAAMKVVDRQVADLSSNRSATIQLNARELEAGTNNFIIRLDHPDPLLIDNERYLSITAQSQRPTLVVADDLDIAKYLQLSIDPRSADSVDIKPMCEQVRFAQLANVSLEKYAVVCLFDPAQLTIADAQRVKEHVQGGGGLLVILGPGFAAANTNPLLMTELLPGKISGIAKREMVDRSCFLEPVAESHPVFQVYGQIAEEVPWNLFPVWLHWNFESLGDNVQTLMKYSDESGAALLAQSLGRGQIFTISTPIPEFSQLDRPQWNELTAAADSWPSYFLILGCVRTLSGADQAKSNFLVGETAILPNDALHWPSRYDLFTPNAQSQRVESIEGALSLGRFEQSGIYRLRGQRGEPVVRAISVNVPAADTTLTRLADEDLNGRLGEGQYHVAHNYDEIESSVGQARFGRELYPLLMLFVAGLFLAEQAMSNRFYKLRFGAAKSASLAKGAA